MPRTAPTVNGTPTYVRVSYLAIDANGQLTSSPYITTLAAATNAHVEAVAVDQGAASNANLYAVEITQVYELAPSTASAVDASRESAKDVVVELWRNNTTRQTQDAYLPAPVDSMFITDTNDVVGTDILFAAWEASVANILPAYAPISFRFSEHKGVNKKTRK